MNLNNLIKKKENMAKKNKKIKKIEVGEKGTSRPRIKVEYHEGGSDTYKGKWWRFFCKKNKKLEL